MPATVKKITDVDVAEFEVGRPMRLNDNERWCACRGPLLQTPEMQLNTKDGLCTILCTEEYADVISQIEEHVIDQIATNSPVWFGRTLSHDDVESMAKSPIRGHRVPRHTVPCAGARAYSHDLEERAAEDGAVSAQCILQIRGMLINETSCELQCQIHQMRLAAPPAAEEDEAADEQPEAEVTLDAPAFLGD